MKFIFFIVRLRILATCLSYIIIIQYACVQFQVEVSCAEAGNEAGDEASTAVKVGVPNLETDMFTNVNRLSKL